MDKQYIAWLILIPVVGCTATVGDDSGAIGAGAESATGTSGAPQVIGSAGNTTASAGSVAIAGSGANDPSGGAGGTSANGGTSSASNGGNCTLEVLPATIQTMLNSRCSTCHGAVPLLPTLPSLLSYANLVAPSKTDPSKTNAVVSLARLQSATMPMPPAPGARATAGEISALQDFIAQGYPKPSCPAGSGGTGGSQANGGASGSGGAGGGAGGIPADDPLAAMPTCTSKTNWTGGNRGSASMNPGMACISCHKSGEGPIFSIAGTVYPTGHEPDKCNSTIGNAGAQIVVIGADGVSVTLTPNSVGNFSSRTAIKTPYQAKVTYQGRERLMLTPQTSGDCNSCHTQNGAMKAPGRITVP